ncbi:hypothetical protein DY000_02005330 [Brassica cretica]|uniref:Aspartic peptidase DDI1-type domain-containing protein n=1 Tax=Brassica cretica TaxID=69181 RepID=A0ABQ7BUB9_BRACR|nr:hypothetical protein DY000_02005330 [Brassica cretica]
MREVETINFHEHEVAKLDMPHDAALVITLELVGTVFSKILVDSGSTVNVVSQKTLRSISQPTPLIDHETTPLNSFEGKSNASLVRDLTVKNPAKDLPSVVALDENCKTRSRPTRPRSMPHVAQSIPGPNL